MFVLGLFFLFLTWATWWGGLVLIIKIDQQRRDQARKAEGGVNFESKDVGSYLLLGLLCGGLVLPLYFWVTRKTASAVLIGFLLGGALFAAATFVSILGNLIMRLAA